MGSSNHTVVTADSKFFIMSTVETFHEISPFLVHKLIQSHIGEVKNVKKLKSEGRKSGAKCSISGHDSSECISDDVKCINCRGNHPAYSRSCPQWILEKEILSTKIRRNISFAEAKKLDTDHNPKPGLLYSSAIKQCSHCGHITDSTKAESNMFSRTISSAIPPSSSQQAKERPVSANTSSTITTSLKQKPESLDKIHIIKATNNQNSSNSKKPGHIKEKKAVKKASFGCLKEKERFDKSPYN
ncbi:hypothetical protein HNY73_021296 [Argiope bruennichi]|uniref:Uncharacterized protein n=1 Tax=Argiope bruennichi TaxID=94029 RepID=A0A8T0EAV7_ARGBR|nr:hypothetical protein HNY73_021296 [Argiope bruennichi]